MRHDLLRPSDRNARTHTTAQVSQIAASIREFGFTNPVLADKNNLIIAGHGRVLAALQLDMPAIPVIRLGHLSERQVRALTLADNKIALNSGWDFARLSEELSELAMLDFDLTLTAFDEQELDVLLKSSSDVLPVWADGAGDTAIGAQPEHQQANKPNNAKPAKNHCPNCAFSW
ncbi:MAG: ParB/Srx family N-terminal domain-containing protein [Saprospiraceae bacterium]